MPAVLPSSPGISPHRGPYGAARPAALGKLPLPPARMPLRRRLRPLKRWRYVGVFGPELMLCVGLARVGGAQQSFWAVWDRGAGRLHERTRLRGGGVRLGMEHPGAVLVEQRGVRIELTLDEVHGVETVSPHGAAFAWTRKQGGVRARGTVALDGGPAREIDALAVVDDSAGYHARRTDWRWSAGVGAAADGRAVAWNLVAGLHDAPQASERTLWVDGEPVEVGPAARFAPDLSAVATDDGVDLRFTAEAVRERREHLLLVRSAYRQPFGAFAGSLPGGITLARGWGVMEEHSARW